MALDPVTRFAHARDANRTQDVIALADAVKLHQVDSGGDYINALDSLNDGSNYLIGTETDTPTCASVTCVVTLVDCVNLADSANGIPANYLASIPTNPGNNWDTALTGYYLRKAGKLLSVGACDPEDLPLIEVAR